MKNISDDRKIEEILIKRCLSGDRQGQRQLYERYAKAMFNICLRMMGHRDETEDLLQESMVDVFSKLHTYRADATIGAWIKRIVINNCINAIRKRKLQITSLDDQFHDPIDLPREYPEDTVCRSDQIRSAIMRLPTGYRTVCNLYMIEGYDHQEIAEILKITESTSKTQYHRGKLKLRALLKEEGIAV